MIERVGRLADGPLLLVLACGLAAGVLQPTTPAGGTGRAVAVLALVLFAVATHRLARVWTGDAWAALPAGVLAALGALAVAIESGHPLVGPAAFLLPLGCHLAEKSLALGNPWYALAAAACAAAPAALEPGLAVPIGAGIVAYVLLRFLLCRTVEIPLPRADAGSFALAAGCVGAGGIAAALGAGSAVWLPAVVAVWLALAALCRRFALVSFAAARNRTGPFFFALLPLAALAAPGARAAWTLPMVAVGSAVPLIGALRLIVLARDPLPMVNWGAALPALLATGVGAALAFGAAPWWQCCAAPAGSGCLAGSFSGGCAGAVLPLSAAVVLLPAVSGWIALVRPEPAADAGRRAAVGLLTFGTAALAGGGFLVLPIVFGGLMASFGLGGAVRRLARARSAGSGG